MIIGDVGTGIVNSLHGQGQSEPGVTNAPVGCSVHWMGCVFSFNVRWDSVHFFSLLTTVLFFFGFVLGCFFFGPDMTHSYPTHLLTFISIVSTLVPY